MMSLCHCQMEKVTSFTHFFCFYLDFLETVVCREQACVCVLVCVCVLGWGISMLAGSCGRGSPQSRRPGAQKVRPAEEASTVSVPPSGDQMFKHINLWGNMPLPNHCVGSQPCLLWEILYGSHEMMRGTCYLEII